MKTWESINLERLVMNTWCRTSVGALMIAAIPLLSSPSGAAPMPLQLALQNAMSPTVETVQYRRGGRSFRRGGAAIGAGISGAIIGGAIIGATQPYGYYRPYYDRRAYYPGYVVVPQYPMYDPVAYCLRRFRSYDPSSGTYLGFDGFRHPCP